MIVCAATNNAGKLKELRRILTRCGHEVKSLRELGVTLGVNPNTIMRTYEHLQSIEIISNKRGVGYFVNTGAKNTIIALQREQFIRDELPKIKRRMNLLGLKPSEIF